MDEPRDLTFERLRALQHERGGPAWRAAVDAGIDVTLLEHNLALTPSERIQQLQQMLRLYFSVAR